MSTPPRRRTSKRSSPRSSSRPSLQASAPGAPPRIPQQRTAEEAADASCAVFVPDDDALLVLHRAAEDPAYQQFLDELPLVTMVGEFLDWVGDGLGPLQVAEEEHERMAALERRIGVDLMTSSGVGRRRLQALSLAATRKGLVAVVGERLEPGPDIAGWTHEDPVVRARVRGQVAAAVLEATVRWMAADHLVGDAVRHTLATILITVGEGQPWPLGLASATRPDDLVAEHVDRIVIEHVAELQALGLCAPGRFLSAAQGAEPVLRSVAVGLRSAPVPPALV